MEDNKIVRRVSKDGKVIGYTFMCEGESVTGLHVPWNLQILTKSENSSKKNKIDWNKND